LSNQKIAPKRPRAQAGRASPKETQAELNPAALANAYIAQMALVESKNYN
jgi:hypothetical protein